MGRGGVASRHSALVTLMAFVPVALQACWPWEHEGCPCGQQITIPRPLPTNSTAGGILWPKTKIIPLQHHTLNQTPSAPWHPQMSPPSQAYHTPTYMCAHAHTLSHTHTHKVVFP